MKRGERIPIHDHSDFDSGGALHAPSVLYAAGLGGPVGTGGSGSSGGSSSSGFELKIEGGQSTIFAHGSMGATETFDPTDGNVHTGTLNANCTFTLNAPTGTGAATLELWLTEDGTGGWAVTWPGSVTEQGTHDTTLSTTSRVILETIDGGTSWIATWIGSSGEPIAVAHIADTLDAHDASAVSVLDTGGYFTATDVEAALAELAVLVAAAGTGAGAHAHVAEETHLSDGSTVTWTLDEVYEPGSVIAWNTTTIARLTVTEVPPDKATVSAAGTTGDKIVFDYAATIA